MLRDGTHSGILANGRDGPGGYIWGSRVGYYVSVCKRCGSWCASPGECDRGYRELLKRRRAAQCREWNASRSHQVKAGKGRAVAFTREYQSRAGHCSFSAFSARFRAQQGLSPLVRSDAQYVRLSDIRGCLGEVVPASFGVLILRSWAMGHLLPVSQFWHGDTRKRHSSLPRQEGPSLFDGLGV